ncbi:MAG: tRNA uracil 4-sulfurtransferase ThiI [Candidatus Bathycorpusculaceae bacterium]
MEFDSIIVRLSGEIGIKSEWTRRLYEEMLIRNVENALKYHRLPAKVIERKRGRIYIETLQAQETISKLTKIFGISSVSPATRTMSDVNTIVQTALNLATNVVKNGSTFAVRCRRTGTHMYSSMDICKEVGRQILSDLKERNLHVNLTRPQHTLSIEVREAKAYVYAETLDGEGGFPVGSQAKVVCLLSGGIDSPVACWLAMKRGCPITPVYIDNAPFTDENATTKALETAKRLFEWSIGFPRKVYIAKNGENLKSIIEKTPRKFACILCKRMMYRIAERIAEKEKAEGIVTGEAIGEQASQTMHNLRVIDEAATRYPIHRPLLGFDKTETESIARKIGTFEISTQRARRCSAAPSKPATEAKLQKVKEAEEKLDIERMVEESVKAAKITKL